MSTSANPVGSPEREVVRLLLVDDHPVMRAGVRSLLVSEPDLELVGEAEDGLSAVRLTNELKPHVVLMDVSLPHLSGVEATRQIAALSPRSKVLGLSAHEDPAFARSLMSAGASGYALKRSACDELVRAIRSVAAGGIYIDPALASALESNDVAASDIGLPSASLSEREAEVIRMISRGHTSKEMAEKLGISPRTLETYKARAMSKLGLRTRADLIRYALRAGWLRDI